MKRIIVTQRIDHLPDRNETRDGLDQRLIQFVADAGGIVFPVPNIFSNRAQLHHWLDQVEPEGIILSGGNDIGDELTRDQLEQELIAYATAHELPVLGICRGMQLLAHYYGATLKTVTDHVACRHQLSGIINQEVNSYHTVAISSLPNEFEVLAMSDDHTIEAIQHKTAPQVGWMWHPEREASFCPDDVRRFRLLFDLDDTLRKAG